MTVINACQRPVVAVKIPEVDEMMQRAQDKVDAIRRVQLRTAGSRPIDEVVFCAECSHLQCGMTAFQQRKSNELLGDASMPVHERAAEKR